MSDVQIAEIAEKAEMIVGGYAFSETEEGFISILNLNHPDSAMTVNREGELLETNMSEIEQQVVLELCRKNLQFMAA